MVRKIWMRDYRICIPCFREGKGGGRGGRGFTWHSTVPCLSPRISSSSRRDLEFMECHFIFFTLVDLSFSRFLAYFSEALYIILNLFPNRE